MVGEQGEAEKKYLRMSAKSVLRAVLLPLQVSLGFWQIVKLTPLAALLECGIACFFSWCRLPLGLSQDYYRLRYLPAYAKLWKRVRCHVTVPPNQPTMQRKVLSNEIKSIKLAYLDVEFHLERRGEYNLELYLDGKMRYYITDTIWYALLDFAQIAHRTVFLKGHKDFWQSVATGGVMSLTDVLDSIILENHVIKTLDNDLLLPVNLSISEEKILKALNLLGLFLRMEEVYWLIPTVLSITAALLEFSTAVRKWLYGKINLLFCYVMHVVCDRLPRSMRRHVYSLGNYVENLKPSNDLQLRIVRGQTRAVIGGGAKVHERDDLIKAEDIGWADFELETQIKKIFSCGGFDPELDAIKIECSFDRKKGKCELYATTVGHAVVECSREEYAKLCQFLACMAKNCSGSLKSCASNHEARVRGFGDSVVCYANNGFPPVYELKLNNVIVVGEQLAQ